MNRTWESLYYFLIQLMYYSFILIILISYIPLNSIFWLGRPEKIYFYYSKDYFFGSKYPTIIWFNLMFDPLSHMGKHDIEMTREHATMHHKTVEAS